MTHCSLTFSANAGMALEFCGVRILVDALHDTAPPGFSSLSSNQVQQLQSHPAFAAPDCLFFTHCHEDHFSPDLVRRFHSRWPGAQLILPERHFDRQLLLEGETLTHSLGMLSLEFLRLPHESPQYAHVPHYGLHLTDGSFHILVAGDCALDSPVLADHLQRFPVDLAILPFPWITLPRGRDFLRAHLSPRHLLVCHIPFPEDDCFLYRKAALQNAQALSGFDVRLLTEPFQQEIF